MELREYMALLRKWLGLILACMILAGGVAFFVSRQSIPIYQASATVMINQASSPSAAAVYADILTAERLSRTYANLLMSRPVVDQTAEQLGIEPRSIERSIDVTPVRDTQLLKITVEGPNPWLIARVANTLPEVFIEQNQELLLGRLSQSRANLEQEIANTEADIARTTDELSRATDDAQKTRLETSLAQYRSTYSTLVANYQQARLAEAQTLDSIVLSEPAIAPERPVRPRTLTNTALAAVVGALLALGIAFLIEYLDDTIKTPDDIERVTGLSTLGAIARLKDAGSARERIAWLRTSAPESEAYRTLRTNIQFSSVDNPVRRLLVTSSSPGEGKSTTAANLGVVLAQTGQRVILVDTDLRRPTLHKVFGIPNNTGLTTALLASQDTPIMEQLQPTEVPDLHILTSGPIPPNPSELLGSQRMAYLIEMLAEVADIIIFDSPPVLAVTDAAVLGRQMDGVLLVVDTGTTHEQVLGNAVAELQKTGVNILGVALNRLDTRRNGYYYYYYHYYYQEDESGERRKHSPRRGTGVRFRLPWPRKAA